MTEITMPSLSDSMTEGTILTWLKDNGEQVAVGDELVEIETDKATMAYESPAAGVLEIVAAVGETLPVGAVIARLGGPPRPTALPPPRATARRQRPDRRWPNRRRPNRRRPTSRWSRPNSSPPA